MAAPKSTSKGSSWCKEAFAANTLTLCSPSIGLCPIKRRHKLTHNDLAYTTTPLIDSTSLYLTSYFLLPLPLPPILLLLLLLANNNWTLKRRNSYVNSSLCFGKTTPARQWSLTNSSSPTLSYLSLSLSRYFGIFFDSGLSQFLHYRYRYICSIPQQEPLNTHTSLQRGQDRI